MLYFEYKIYFSNSTPNTRIFPTSEMDFKELAERSSSRDEFELEISGSSEPEL